MTVYFMVFPSPPARVRYGKFQDQEDQDDQDAFEGFEGPKSRRSRRSQDKTKTLQDKTSRAKSKSVKTRSRLRVTGSRHSKQTAGLPYGRAEEDEKEVKTFAPSPEKLRTCVAGLSHGSNDAFKEVCKGPQGQT